MDISKEDSIIYNLKQEGSEYDINSWINLWHNKIGVNILHANPRQKFPSIEWKEWNDRPITGSKIREWKEQNRFKGIIIMPGKDLRRDHKGEYSIYFDLDIREAIDAFCTRDGKQPH